MMILVGEEPSIPAEIVPIVIDMAKAVARATDHTIQTVIEIVDVTKTARVVVVDRAVQAVDRPRTTMNRPDDILNKDLPLVVK